MRLRYKILSGFLILAIMLCTAGGVSIIEFHKISHSVQALLDDNYRSITAAKNMIEALEREDSGILLLMSGDWENGRATLQEADRDFNAAFSVASNNITISGEREHVSAIGRAYERYKALWERPIVDTRREGNLDWYFSKAHPSFLEVKETVNQVMGVNDRAMYFTASELKNRAGRAIMPGIVAIFSALFFTVIFNYFINIYVIRPIMGLIDMVRIYMKSGELIKFHVDTRDEIFKLTETIRELISFIKKGEKGA